MSELTARFDAICRRLGDAAAASGRNPEAVRLVAVSKRQDATAVAELAVYWATRRAGRAEPIFGENYMQEAREKMPQVAALLDRTAPGVVPRWHFVGHVQTKKARDIAGRFQLLHSVDSLKLAEALDKAWQTRVAGAPLTPGEAPPGPQDILVQVNVGHEAQKSGVDPDGLEPLLRGILALPGLQVRGLMCLPPLREIGGGSRPYFIMLRELRDRMERACGLALPELSMGMSDDFEAAVEEGATLVRIGTDIFGPRK